MVADRIALDALNALDRDAFTAELGGIYEHSPWVAETAWDARPFGSVDALHGAMQRVVEDAPVARRLALIRAHPDLAPERLEAANLTAASASEQASAGLDRLDAASRERLRAANAAYRERFGFSCIVCVREHGSAAAIIDAIEARTGDTPEGQIDACVREIGKIARLRLADRVAGAGRG